MNVLEDNIGKKVCDLGLDNGFLEMTIKTKQKKKELDFIKIKTFLFQRLLSRKWKDNWQNRKKYLQIIYPERNFLMFKLVLEKAEEPEVKLPTSTGSWEKQESSRKTPISALLTMPKPLTVWITINCGKFWKRWEYQTTWPASWEICMQVRKQQLELDMEQQTGSK